MDRIVQMMHGILYYIIFLKDLGNYTYAERCAFEKEYSWGVGYYTSYMYCSDGCCGYYYHQNCCFMAGGSLVGIVIGSLVGLGAFASISYVICSMCNRGGMQNSDRPIINRRTRPQVAFIRTRTRIPKDSIPSCTDLWLLEGSTKPNKLFRSDHPPRHFTQDPNVKRGLCNSKSPTYLQAGFKYDVALAGYPPPAYPVVVKQGLTKG